MTAPQTEAPPESGDTGSSTPTEERKQTTTTDVGDRLGVGNLPANIRGALYLRKQQAEVINKMAGMEWGKALTPDTRRALAEWSERHNIDPITEIYVLGGNVYKNAVYYINRLAKLVDLGLVVYAYADHVEVDKRLEAMAKDTSRPERAKKAQDELDRRADERISHKIPDAAEGAVIFRIKLENVDREFASANWCGGGTRKNDPVGNERPELTAESRAARRCIRFIAKKDPTLKPMIEGESEDGELTELAMAIRKGLSELHAEIEKMHKFGAAGLASPDGAYGESAESLAKPKPREIRSAAESLPDPYTDTRRSVSAPIEGVPAVQKRS